MPQNYPMPPQLQWRIALAIAYSQAMQVVHSKMLDKFILIYN